MDDAVQFMHRGIGVRMTDEADTDRYRHLEFTGQPRLRPSVIRERLFSQPISRRTAVEAIEALDAEERAFYEWLLAQAGLDRAHYRPRPLQRRLTSCLRALQARSVAEARKTLLRHPELLPRALSAVVIGVTAFFRDAEVFETIDSTVLPELLRQHRAISVWSVACSDGAELYSIAMLLHEQGGLCRGRLLGTDCRAQAIQTAQRGEYDDTALAALEPGRRERYFIPLAGNRRRVSPLLRSACRWQTADVFACADAAAWDMVLCRNLAIYLEPVAAAELWQRLARALRPGGWLVVGKAERPCRDLPLHRVGPCIYRKEEER